MYSIHQRIRFRITFGVPFCGDSYNENHGHLSIKIDVNSDAPMVYRCLKCEIHGLVNETFLEEIGVYLDPESKKELKIYTKKSMRAGKLVNMDRENYFVPLSQESDLVKRKIDYLSDRLGIPFDVHFSQNHKIILSFFDFLKANDLLVVDDDHLVGLSYKMICNLNENYVGFLSTNNNCIVFRDISGKQKYRYYKVVINGRNINMDSFYSCPSRFDLLYTNNLTIHIAEGVFDILSIKENLIKEDTHNMFYASCGFGSISIFKYLIHYGINTGITVRIYSDNDKTDWNHQKYLRYSTHLLNFVDHLYLHRNGYPNEKDYGIPIERIQDTKRVLK